jgi:truncated hemoglobin YjbI
MSKSLYEQIGEEIISTVIAEFYELAFTDPIIGHFFFTHDRAELVRKQTIFCSCMLGATHITYTGKSLQEAHKSLPLRDAHFRRRQVLMAEVLERTSLSPALIAKWLEREEKLKSLIVNA